MGFKTSKAVEQKVNEIIIPLRVTVTYEDGDNTPETEMVTHIMRMPESSEREKHQALLVKVRGQSVKAKGSVEANFWLWSRCWIRLEGYDDLPETREQINKLFEDSPILHIHAESAAQALLSRIGAEEEEVIKK